MMLPSSQQQHSSMSAKHAIVLKASQQHMHHWQLAEGTLSPLDCDCMYCCTAPQVLMESTTFNAIKERLAELGAVDENGMNFKRLSWKAKAGWFSWLGALNRTLTR